MKNKAKEKRTGKRYAQTKCFDCKNNARLEFKGVVPLCIATGSKEYEDVVSCLYYELAEPND